MVETGNVETGDGAAEPGPDGPDRSSERGNHGRWFGLARVAIALLAAGLLVWAAAGLVPAGRTAIGTARNPAGPTDASFAMAARFDCVRQQLAERLPPGSVVTIGDLTATADVEQWRQRLSELAFPGATVTDDPSRADFAISVVPVGEAGTCWGFDVIVTAAGR